MNVQRIVTDGRATSTGPLMRQMVETYFMDMAPYAHLNLSEVFDIIKNIPFRPDPPTVETLMRPYYTLSSKGYGGDCDDKAIAMASYARLSKIPYRFVAVRRAHRKVLHHVFCQLYINNNWFTVDPTYNFNVLGREREGYAERIII